MEATGMELEWFAMGPGAHMRLPEVLEDVAEVIGRRMAVRLADRVRGRGGGSRAWRVWCYIPARVGSDHWLVACIGSDAAAALAYTHGGVNIEVPICRELQQAARRWNAEQRRAETRARVAEDLGWPAGEVERLLAPAPEARRRVRAHPRLRVLA